jgi:hypothetical protein
LFSRSRSRSVDARAPPPRSVSEWCDAFVTKFETVMGDDMNWTPTPVGFTDPYLDMGKGTGVWVTFRLESMAWLTEQLDDDRARRAFLEPHGTMPILHVYNLVPGQYAGDGTMEAGLALALTTLLDRHAAWLAAAVVTFGPTATANMSAALRYNVRWLPLRRGDRQKRRSGEAGMGMVALSAALLAGAHMDTLNKNASSAVTALLRGFDIGALVIQPDERANGVYVRATSPVGNTVVCLELVCLPDTAARPTPEQRRACEITYIQGRYKGRTSELKQAMPLQWAPANAIVVVGIEVNGTTVVDSAAELVARRILLNKELPDDSEDVAAARLVLGKLAPGGTNAVARLLVVEFLAWLGLANVDIVLSDAVFQDVYSTAHFLQEKNKTRRAQEAYDLPEQLTTLLERFCPVPGGNHGYRFFSAPAPAMPPQQQQQQVRCRRRTRVEAFGSDSESSGDDYMPAMKRARNDY